MKTSNFKPGTLCFWNGLNPGFVIILGDCKSFSDSYSAFYLSELTSKDISLSEIHLRKATAKEKRVLIQMLR